MKRRRKKRGHRGEQAADADARLQEARQMKAVTVDRAPAVRALAAEATRLARKNRIAEAVYLGLLNGGHTDAARFH